MRNSSLGQVMAATGVELGRAVVASELVAKYGGTLRGAPAAALVARVVRPSDSSAETDLVVLNSARWLRVAAGSVGLVLCHPELAPALPEARCWLHDHVSWALACVLADLARDAMAPPETSAHEFVTAALPHAHVSRQASIGPDVSVEPGVVVFAGASVGAGCHLAANSVIYPRVALGQRVRVGAGSVLGAEGFGIATGPRGATRRIPQLAGVVIEDDVELGALCSVDAGTLSPTRIGAGSRLDAQVHVGHNVCLGARVVVAAQVGFGGSAQVGDQVLVGGQAGIADHVQIGPGARLAARSGVIGDVRAGSVVAGYPAMAKGEWLRSVGWVRRQVLELRGRRGR